MANILILNQPQVSQGLTTYTYTVPTTGVYNVQCEARVNQSLATGFGAGSGADQGNGATGGVQGIGQGSNLSLGNGGKGLGFGTASPSDGASGTNGYGSGAGGGELSGFAVGGSGSAGHTGQGFGATNSGYNQPITNVTTPTTVAGAASALVILVKQNGTTVFTAPTFAPTQSAMQFKYDALFTAADVITVTLTSANASDKLLNSTQLTVSIGTGQ